MLPDKNMSLPQEIRSVVEWSGDISVDYPVELAPNQPFRVTADTSFVIKGWLFKKEFDGGGLSNVLSVSVNTENVMGGLADDINSSVIYTVNNETLTSPLSII